ncbi:MAG: hypothetical protein ABSG53_19905, partial [Thermoguttaceae bacterium]
ADQASTIEQADVKVMKQSDAALIAKLNATDSALQTCESALAKLGDTTDASTIQADMQTVKADEAAVKASDYTNGAYKVPDDLKAAVNQVTVDKNAAIADVKAGDTAKTSNDIIVLGNDVNNVTVIGIHDIDNVQTNIANDVQAATKAQQDIASFQTHSLGIFAGNPTAITIVNPSGSQTTTGPHFKVELYRTGSTLTARLVGGGWDVAVEGTNTTIWEPATFVKLNNCTVDANGNVTGSITFGFGNAGVQRSDTLVLNQATLSNTAFTALNLTDPNDANVSGSIGLVLQR